LPELPGEAFHEREPEVACRPGHQCHTIHDLMYIALADLGRDPEGDPRTRVRLRVVVVRSGRLVGISVDDRSQAKGVTQRIYGEQLLCMGNRRFPPALRLRKGGRRMVQPLTRIRRPPWHHRP
jgi:hypothetical protein